MRLSIAATLPRQRLHVTTMTSRALDIFTQLNPKQLYLTHIGHELDRWLQTQTLLPENVHAAYDELVLGL